MSSTTQEKLYETFAAVSGGQTSNPDAVIDASEEIASSVRDLGNLMRPMAQAATPLSTSSTSATSTASTAGTAQSIASTVLQNVFGTVPLLDTISGHQSSSSSSSSSGGIGSTLESVASTVLKSGLGLVPLIGGLIGLFGGGDSTPAPTLEKYAMPASIAFEGADTGAGVTAADYDQMGMARTYGGDGAASSSAPPSTAAPASTSNSASPSQITVNVQAMDARSFLDRSSDIAAAVRDAMLNLNSINDVVNDL